MTGFVLGIICTVATQQAWKYRDLAPGAWAWIKTKFRGAK